MELILAAISGSALLNAVIWIVIAGLIFWLLNYLVDYVAMGEPFTKIAKVIIMLVAIVILINALLTIAGKPFVTF